MAGRRWPREREPGAKGWGRRWRPSARPSRASSGPRRSGDRGGRRPRTDSRVGSLTMAFWRRIWQRDGDHGLASCTALDVGTEFAKALVFEIDDTGHGTVRGVGRKRQGLSHMQSGTVADIAAVVDNCAVALQEAEEMAGFRPNQVVIGIAGELVKGFTTSHTPGAQEARPADLRGGAPEAHRRRPARGAARGRAVDHLGDRPAARRRPAGPRRGHRRHRSTATR